MSKSKEIYDLTLVLFYTTEKAYIVGETEARDSSVALPISQVEIGEQTGMVRGLPIHTFQVPAWLAIEKKLV